MQPARRTDTHRIPGFAELYAGICGLPEGVTGEILEDGRIETMSRPGRGHRRSGKRLARIVGALEDEAERHGWIFEPEAEVRLLVERLLVPDLAGWRIGDEGADFLDVNPIERVPDWVCEVLSATTLRKDRLQKLPIYAEAGVAHIWLVDPERRRIEVYSPQDGLPVAVAAVEGEGPVKLPPFDLEFQLDSLWVPRRL